MLTAADAFRHEPEGSGPWWGQLIQTEPRLADLAAAVRRGKFRDWDEVVARAAVFVGAMARQPRLRRVDAWRCAIEHLRVAYDSRDRQGCRCMSDIVAELLPRYGFTPTEIATQWHEGQP